MSSIDNRIVKMELDNSKFTNAANSTMSTLQKLGQSLKLTDGAKGLENISSKVKGVDMSSLASSVDQVASRFSAMDIIGVTALVNIANTAVNTGTRMIKSLTLDPITSGFEEYETKMNAITTIMTNTADKGTTLDQVTAALDDLNEYADKTIYNFAEMTRNIGTFTAAGVGLEDATIAIKGIANLAAGSGSSSAQASTAMYQLSQALASGTVNLQDWNSVVNAGMGGQLFQNKLKEVGLRMGANIDLSQTFRESISSKDGTGWLTSDILLESLKELAADKSLEKAATEVKTYTQLIGTMQESVQSGWGKSWEWIIGDQKQAAAFFTAISDGFGDIMGSMALYRNMALETWNKEGGRDAFIKGLSNMATAIGRIIGPIYKAYVKIIDPWNGKRLISLSQGFEWLTSKLILGEKASSGIGKTFEGLFSIIKMVGTILKPVAALFGGLVSVAMPLLGIIPRITGVLGSLVAKFADFVNGSGAFDWVIKQMANSAEWLSNSLDWLFESSDSWLNKGISVAEGYIADFTGVMDGMVQKGMEKLSGARAFVKEFNETYKPVELAGVYIGKAAEAVKAGVEMLRDGFEGLVELTKKGMTAIQNMVDKIMGKFSEMGVAGIDFVNAGLIGAVILLLRKVIKFFKEFGSVASSFTDSFVGVMGDLSDVLQAYQKDLKAEMLKKIAIAVALLAGSIFILSKIEPSKLLPAISALGALLTGVVGSLYILGKIDFDKLKGVNKAMVAMIAMAISVNILATAMVKLSKLSFGEIMKSIVGLAGAVVALSGLMVVLTVTNFSPAQATSLLALSTSLVILGAALKLISTIKPGDLLRSLLAMGAAIVGISFFLNSTGGVKNSVSVALSLLPLTTSMLLLSAALFTFSMISTDRLMKGFTVLAITLMQFSIFMQSIRGSSKNMLAVGAGILLISDALLVLTGAIFMLGNMNPKTLAIGLLALTGILASLVFAISALPKDTGLKAGGIIALATGITILAAAVALYGNMDLSTLAKGILAVAAILAILVGVSTLATGALPVLAGFSLGVGLLSLALVALGGALLLASFGITSFAAAVAATGVGIMSGLMAIIAVIPALAASLALGLVSFITILGYNAAPLQRSLVSLVKMVLAVLIEATPRFAEWVTIMALEILKALQTIFPEFIATIRVLLNSVLTMIIEETPKLVEAVGVLLLGLCNLLIQNIPVIVNTVLVVISEILRVLADNIPVIAAEAARLVIDLVAALLTELAIGVPKVATAVTDIIVAIIDTLANNTVRVINAIWNFIITIINGMADSIETNSPRVREAIGRLIVAMVTDLGRSIGDFIGIGGDIVSGIAKGIGNAAGKAVDAVKGLAGKALNAAKNFLGIHSPSREFAKLGKFSSEGMAIGIKKNAGLVSDEAESMGNSALDSMRNAMSAASSILDDDMSSSPVITPVLDLSEIQNGANSINGMIDSAGAIQANVNAVGRISSSLGAASELASNTTNNSSNTSINNTFNITGDNPRSIADEVNKLLQLQVERRKAVWA